MNIFKHGKLCAGYLGRYLRGTKGVAAMEYAIVVGVIVVGIGIAAAAFQTDIRNFIDGMSDRVSTTTIAAPS